MDFKEFADDYLNRMAVDENAFFALIEAPGEIVSFLESAFRSESDAVRRAAILNVIWQRRDRTTIPLLGEALRDASPRVWKEALDGLVALGSQESILAVQSARSRAFASEVDSREFREFLDEALEQLTAEILSRPERDHEGDHR